MTHYQLIDGRLTANADRMHPERCTTCKRSGFALAPNDHGQLTCSRCDPWGWERELATFGITTPARPKPRRCPQGRQGRDT